MGVKPVTLDKPSGRVIGSSRFGNIDPANSKAEIGWTWITPAFQRTHVNSEAKLLMMTHAFEVLDTEWPAMKERLRGFLSRGPEEAVSV